MCMIFFKYSNSVVQYIKGITNIKTIYDAKTCIGKTVFLYMKHLSCMEKVSIYSQNWICYFGRHPIPLGQWCEGINPPFQNKLDIPYGNAIFTNTLSVMKNRINTVPIK